MGNTGGPGEREVNDSGGSAELGADAEGVEAARKSRRNALKAGVAVGVGVTAWAAPQIGRLGGTPAYAQECTIPFTGVWLGCSSTNAACADGVRYNPIGSAFSSINFGTGGVLTQNFSGSGNPNGTDSGCPGVSTVTIKVPTDQAGCRLTIIVHENNCSSWVDTPYWDSAAQEIKQGDDSSIVELDRASTDIVVGAGAEDDVLLPAVPCNGAGGGTIACNVFWSAVVECNTSENCV